ncbi:MAG: hypothetical protein JJT99_03065 [Rhodobacteraceae bacterium]|nr:hypothetical protein [Paracoccaceae bacterium]
MVFRFAKDESGAASVDWLVLSAVIVALGASSAAVVLSDATGVGSHLRTSISSIVVGGAAPLKEQDYEWRAHDGDATHWWTNMELRTLRYNGLTDSQLQSHWTRHLDEFNAAVATGDNRKCHQCKGAGNRLDALYITHQIRVERGLASDSDALALHNAITTYDQTFGN